MMGRVPGIQKIVLMAAGSVILVGLGCSATQVALEKKGLKVQTKMSQSIFLDLDNQIEKSAFLEIKNTSDKEIDFDTPVRKAIENRGYKIVDNAKEAAYIYQVNVLYVGEADPAALRTAVHAGYGSAWAGGAVGGAVGYGLGGTGRSAALGAGIGGFLVGATELVTGSLTKDVTFAVMTDLQLTEKTSKGKKIHQARVASTAEQVNLEWEETKDPLVQGLAKSLGGLL